MSIIFNFSFKSPSSNAGLQQLIPGSILINDKGEIDNLSYKQNTNFDSNTSTNSFHPGGEYISDDSGGPGGYLVPTHIQRRIVTSPSGINVNPQNQVDYQRSTSLSNANTHNRPEFNRQQTFPQKTDHDIQSWVNPYWPKSNQTNTQSSQNNNTKLNDSQQSSQNKPSQTSASSTNAWENPYLKDQSSTPSKPKDQKWENPYWKDKNSSNGLALEGSLPSEYKVPSFYERIHPPPSPTQAKHENMLSTETSKLTTNDNDDLPYTIDKQGVAHYRSEPSSINNTDKTVNFASAPTTTQPSVPPQNLPNTVSTSQKPNNAPPPSLPILNDYPLLSFNYSSLTTSSSNVLTEEDVNSIQHALHLLKTNSNSIPVIEVPNQVHQTNASSPFASLFTSNHQQQQQQLPSTSSQFASIITRNQQQQQQPTSSSSPFASLFTTNQQQPASSLSPLVSLFTRNQQQPASSSSPFASLATHNQQQPTSSFPSLITYDQQQQQSHPQPSSSPFASLAANNQQQPASSSSLITHKQQQPTSSSSSFPSLITDDQQQSHPQSPSSPFASLAAYNEQQQAHNQQPTSSPSKNVPFDSSSHEYDAYCQQSTLPSKPSYPSHLEESIRHLLASTSIALI